MLTTSLVWIAGASAADAAPGARLGEALGRIIAQHFARFLPMPHAATPTDPRGGDFCDVLGAYHWPPPILDSDLVNPKLAGVLADTLDHGVEYCGWKP